MADILQKYYEQLFDILLTPTGKIKVRTDFYGQMAQIDKILNNDYTALISSILEFMIEACTTDIIFDTNNENYTKAFKDWKKEINTGLNLDIPRGFRSLTEQYYRERFRSSFIVLQAKWGMIDGLWMPTKMWFMDGASIYAKNEGTGLNTIEYYFGKPKDDKSNLLQQETTDGFVLVRKPYNQWTDLTPTPYLVKVGAIYHALLKSTILNRQADIVGTSFPMGFFIKAGCEEAMRKNQMPTEEDLKKLEKKFQQLKTDSATHPFNTGLVGAFPFDVNFESLIPDYSKALDEKILKGTDKNILSALGMIEFKGFSSNREEAILNPKVLVERCEDAVLDYVELFDDVVALIKIKNEKEHRKTSNVDVRLHSSIIKAFVDDKMRNLIRGWYDRGLIAKQDAIENTTPLDFETQINHRNLETKKNLNEIMYPPVTQNFEKDINDPSEPIDEEVPEDKQPNTPESQNYNNANSDENYIEAPYTKENYPAQLKNLPVGARNLWIRTFNRVLEETGDEDQARQAAWGNVKNRYKKVGDKWVKKS